MAKKDLVAKVFDGLDKVIVRHGHSGYLCMWCGAHQDEVVALIVGYTGGCATGLCAECIRTAFHALPQSLRGPSF